VRVLKKKEKNGRETERVDKGKGEARVVGMPAAPGGHSLPLLLVVRIKMFDTEG
jgi:hypothetical protein